MNEVVIAAAARTPVGAFNGGLSPVPAHHLGQVAIEEAMRRAAVAPEEVDEVVMGQILAAGAGQNPARQAAVNAGIPVERTAYGVNQLCGSGLRTVALGYQAIRVGDSDVVVAGGHESMSQAPHCLHMRNGTKMGATELVDTMLRDGLLDAFNGYHMGSTAENVAERWQITRDQQDAFAAASQHKAEQAQKAGRFAEEIVPVTISDPQGRDHRRHRRASEARHHRRDTGEAPPRVREGRDGDGRERLGDQRRRGGGGAHDPGERREARHRAAGANRLLGHRRRGPGDHGHRPHPGQPPRPRRRRGGAPTIWTSWRRTRRSRRRRAR